MSASEQEMASSPSASPFSVGSDNSTECFRGASSQQMSFEGHTDDAAWIPDEILSYQPKPTEILKPSPGGGPPVRLIFGDLDLLPHEVEGLNELRKLIENDKELAESTLFADDRYCVRFLQGNDWDTSRCVGDMKRHIHWRAETLPIYRSAVEPLLAEVMPVVIYWLEFTLEKLLVKNKVEQWRVVIDLEDCSITSAPISILKQVCDTLTLVSVVLPERTKSKIRLTSSWNDEEFMASINPSQLEARYGGKCLNVQDFRWPVLPPSTFEGSA